MKRFVIIIITILFYTIKASAQFSIGLNIGINTNKIRYNDSQTQVQLQSNTGYLNSIVINVMFKKCILVEASPGLIQKNYRVTNQLRIAQKLQNNYLQLPLSLEIPVHNFKKLSICMNGGGYFAYWLSGTIVGQVPNVFDLDNNATGETIKLVTIKSNYVFNKDIDHRIECGWLAGIKIKRMINKSMQIYIQTQLYSSLTDQQKRYSQLQTSKLNQTMATSIGFMKSL